MDPVYQLVYNCLPPHYVVGSRGDDGGGGEDAVGDGEDRISRLPDSVLSNILSRLPLKNAMATQVLSHRFYPLWKKVPLVLDDLSLLEMKMDHNQRIHCISCLLLLHPGPFQSVRLTTMFFGQPECSRALRMWLNLMSKKQTRTLILANPALPYDLPIPADILRCSQLQQLYLAFVRFPAACQTVSYPELHDLVLGSTQIQSNDVSYLVRASPQLQRIGFVMNLGHPTNIDLRKNSKLELIVLWHSLTERLSLGVQVQRLIILNNYSTRNIKTELHLPKSSKVRVLGFLDLGYDEIFIDNCVIQSWKKHTLKTVHVLALKVRFGDIEQSKVFVACMRCFPKIETFHLDASGESGESMSSSIWKKRIWKKRFRGIESITNSIRYFFFHNFRGRKSEMEFMKFFIREAEFLKYAVFIVPPKFDSREAWEVWDKINDLGNYPRASKSLELLVTTESPSITFEMAFNKGIIDPFYNMEGKRITSQVEPSQPLVSVGRCGEETGTRLVTLVSGDKMPDMGLAIKWTVDDANVDKPIDDVLCTALDFGYRHFIFDDSLLYNVPAHGLAFARVGQVKREDFFVTIKVTAGISKTVTRRCFEVLSALNLDYADLCVATFYGDGDSMTTSAAQSSYKGLKKLFSMGCARNIGLSNCTNRLIEMCCQKDFELSVVIDPLILPTGIDQMLGIHVMLTDKDSGQDPTFMEFTERLKKLGIFESIDNMRGLGLARVIEPEEN